jgi:uncharacterized protein YcbK (DUF882 family)
MVMTQTLIKPWPHVISKPGRRLKQDALRLHRGGVGYYRSSDFVHVDVGRVRHW